MQSSKQAYDMKNKIFVTAIALLLLSAGAQAIDLVRVRVSAMTGAEAGTISSITDPGLFVLDPGVASATLTFQNPAAPTKSNHGAATWQPPLTPLSVSSPNPAGFIQLTITPAAGASISYGSISYTVGAVFAANPSSLRLQSSLDGFASTLSTINLAAPVTETVSLSTPSSNAPIQFRWEANDDFGANGGGEAGFLSNDLVVSDATRTVPTLGLVGLIGLALALLLLGLRRLH